MLGILRYVSWMFKQMTVRTTFSTIVLMPSTPRQNFYACAPQLTQPCFLCACESNISNIHTVQVHIFLQMPPLCTALDVCTPQVDSALQCRVYLSTCLLVCKYAYKPQQYDFSITKRYMWSNDFVTVDKANSMGTCTAVSTRCLSAALKQQ